MKILVLCTSNSCRSQMAEGWLRSWDFMITVCGGAAEACPRFIGTIGRRVHIGVEDPAEIQGTKEVVRAGFRKIRDELRRRLAEFYVQDIQGRELPPCECNDGKR